VAAALVWFFAPAGRGRELVSAHAMAGIVSLAAGALLANLVSVTILIVETTCSGADVKPAACCCWACAVCAGR
jgi:hypothetical protein